MKTLIELYDERPVENVISTDVYRPDNTVYICSPEIAANTQMQKKLTQYFRARRINTKLHFLPAGMVEAGEVAQRIREVIAAYPDCAMDIAGGTDDALFAAGQICSENDIPVFTYSRKRNTFFSVRNAPFADTVPCTLRLNVKECILMAGGSIRTGRVDNDILSGYLDLIDPFFEVFLRFKKDWVRIVTYFQRISQEDPEALLVTGGKDVKGDHGSRIAMPREALQALEKAGMIHELEFKNDTVLFKFHDLQCRSWLRDVGSVLELYVYKACRDLDIFDDVRTSVIVDWEGDNKPDAVTNEIDVVVTQGTRPFFISCKTCPVKTEALNELGILRERFGSGIARAAIVTTEQGKSIMYQRAREMGIDVIDLNDIRKGLIGEKLRTMTRMG